jgi:hypothetical protein
VKLIQDIRKSFDNQSVPEGRELEESRGIVIEGKCTGPVSAEPERSIVIGDVQSFVIEPADQEPREVQPKDVSPATLRALAGAIIPRRSSSDLQRTLDQFRTHGRLAQLGVRVTPPRLPRSRRDRAELEAAADRDPRVRAGLDAARQAERRAAAQDGPRIY